MVFEKKTIRFEHERIHSLFVLVVATPLTDGANRANGQSTTSAANKPGEQRYFRVPFVRPNEQNRDANVEHKKKGWWYAHFDGKCHN